ncbi:MAG TPA: glycine zipper 2TM domain-containing protein [Gammaproteobacteria bacterium]|nr:glycine zipper 2TM domain-containing protein [Gammaproteobacteria bacterium]
MKNSSKLVTTAIVSALLVAPLSQSAQANGGGYHDYATVTDVQPITRSIRISQPTQRCWQEYQQVPVRNGSYRGRSSTPEIFGAILGAAVGSRFGRGRGRGWATAAGALLGGSIGHDMKNAHRGYRYRSDEQRFTTRSVRRCETVDNYTTEEQVVAYRVSYRYNGRQFTTRMQNRPGASIQVRVRVRPYKR